MYARVLTSCVMMLLSILSTQGQWPELRYENIPILPENVLVRGGGNRYFARLHNGYYVLDSASTHWRHLGVESERWSIPSSMNFHPDGTATLGTGPVIRFRTDTEMPEIREGTYYTLEYNDSIVCRMVERDIDAETNMTIVRWWTWRSRDTLQIDTVYVQRGGVKPFSIACGDTTMLSVHNSAIYKYRLGSKPVKITTPLPVVDGDHHTTIGTNFTHILLNANESWLYSSDHGISWSIVAKEAPSCWAMQTTRHPNELIGACGARIIRIRLPYRAVDTVLLDKALTGYSSVTHGPLGTLVNINDSVFVIDDVTNQHRRIESGLPKQTISDLIHVNDGIAAMSKREIAFRPSRGDWFAVTVRDSTNLFRDDMFTSEYFNIHRFIGGRSFDDLWMNRGGNINWHRPIGNTHLAVPWTNQGVSFWADPDGSRILAVKDVERNYHIRWHYVDGSEQFLQLSGSVFHVMSFGDTAIVALCRDGSYWRTINGDVNRWELKHLPTSFPKSDIVSESKGRVGLCLAPDKLLIAYDGGLYWRVSSRKWRTVSAITAGGIVYTAEIELDTNTLDLYLRVYRELGDSRTIIGVYELSDTYHMNPYLLDAAYDDSEHRLFLTTNHWVASIPILPVSSIDDDHEIVPNLTSYGCYDLLGQLIARNREDLAQPGVYLIISKEGVKQIYHTGK